MRMVVSLADLDDSRWINLTGVSGHPFHEHYSDQTDLWARGETLPWPFTADAVMDAGEHTMLVSQDRGGVPDGVDPVTRRWCGSTGASGPASSWYRRTPPGVTKGARPRARWWGPRRGRAGHRVAVRRGRGR